ncbi:protein of unknown function [Methylocaldum szegediense]|uniref:Uncharacterized protein n=1 Tax=Methylocaldum szegediense TaxID=73780 RepID=A0ABM9HX97_9GAMM|nr:protein of unknown function [Methylocaldum szegediense]
MPLETEDAAVSRRRLTGYTWAVFFTRPILTCLVILSLITCRLMPDVMCLRKPSENSVSLP